MKRIIASIAACFFVMTTAANAAETNWGLAFRGKNQPPVGDATPSYLEQFGAAYIGDTSVKKMYLTFDAGYENGCTPGILDTLKKRGVPAAFFIVGHYLESAPDLVRRMADEGHTVANHTYHHPNMSKISDPGEFKKEIEGVETLYREVTGAELKKYYRPPQGIYSEENLKQAQKLGYRTAFWSLAYVDWRRDEQPEPAAALTKLMSRVHPGAVILLHSTSKTNEIILDDFLAKCAAEGYAFGTLDELFAGK